MRQTSLGSFVVVGAVVGAALLGSACQQEPRPNKELGIAPRTTTGGTAPADGGSPSEGGLRQAGAGGLVGGASGSGAGGRGGQGGAADSGGAGGRGGAVDGGGGPIVAGQGGEEEQGGAGAGTGGAGTGGTGGSVVLVSVGAPCASSAECDAGATCYEGPGSSERTCRVACPLTEVGVEGDCGDGYVCALSTSAHGAACLAVCELGDSTCADEDWCVPRPDPAYTGGEAVTGLCNTRGSVTAGAGEPCDDGACAAGLGCYSPNYAGGGPERCEPLCDATAATVADSGCFSGETCRALTQELGVCIRLCDPLGANGCPSGEWCHPYFVTGVDGAVLEGQCVRPGTVGAGEACAPGGCVEGHVCASLASPFGASAATCRGLCDPEEPACSGDQACVQLEDGQPGIGICQEGCAPFAAGAAADCDAAEWCAPATAAGLGVCAQAGAAELGAPCTRATDCAAGAYCDCRFGADHFCATDGGRCEAACDPAATGAEPGACAEASTCVPEIVAGVRQGFGICRPSCDHDASGGCADPDESCVAAELVGALADACVDVPTAEYGELCDITELEVGDPCGARGSCALPEPASPPTCVEACRVVVGEIGSTPHPDCASEAATCVELAPDLGYGRCE